ncbi:hypothetical protein BKA58DRAFT_391895 [Alternaria rosae]|uniref:uncharacterized protein n=1 Tax=Alternaria rosae TaxID=1187941 RepID=UPI001E8D6ABC|nr:uncharacterized protein BKA58DRAFT_391895 [Alternaria rosae]KAH6860644.1 hypothetical protein BKA58DRAFT_391895 [Alternaria rosae]
MSTTLDQQKEAALALLSGMLTTVLQKEWKITDRLSAQSALLDALLPKPAPVPITAIKKQDIFHIGDRVFDLGPEHESEASPDDDAPIRNARQLKSEMRRVKAIQRRANRRAARCQMRIAAHLGKTEAIPEFETLKMVEEPLDQRSNPIVLDEDAIEVTPTVKTTDSVAETPVRMLKELEDYSSPARSTPLSSALTSPKSAEFSPLVSEIEQEVADYDGVDSPMSDPVQVPGRLQGYSCEACDFKTHYAQNYTRHLQGTMHRNKVAGCLQRKGPNIKFVKKASSQRQERVKKDALGRPQRHCTDCDRTLLASHWTCHIKGRMHQDNAARDKQSPPLQGTKTREDYVKSLKRYCKNCDRHFTSNNWGGHLKARAHLKNVAKVKEEEESMANYDSATDEEIIVYDNATDEESASPSPSPSSSSSRSSSSSLLSVSPITFSHDGTSVADLASTPSLTSSVASFASSPPSTPACAASPSQQQDFYCETCNATILSARP